MDSITDVFASLLPVLDEAELAALEASFARVDDAQRTAELANSELAGHIQNLVEIHTAHE